MSIRMNYFRQPCDYTQELKRKGIRGRRKSMAFKDYIEDIEVGEFNSERFYAEAWNVSKTTARNWIAEFKHEIDRFSYFWQLKNNAHNTYINRQSDQSDQVEVTKENQYNDCMRVKSSCTSDQGDQVEVTKEFNQNNNSSRAKLARDFFTIYRLNNGKYTGSRNDAIEEYMNVDDISHSQLLFALRAYKESGEQMVGAAKFLRDRIYLSYVEIRLRAFVDGTWVLGDYDSGNAVFSCDNGIEYRLTPERMTEKFAKGEIEFVRSAA